MATDPEEVPAVVEAWHDRRMDVPLVLVEAPFRDLGPPLLAEIRSRTARGDTVVTVVSRSSCRSIGGRACCTTSRRCSSNGCCCSSPTSCVTSVPFHLSAPETS